MRMVLKTEQKKNSFSNENGQCGPGFKIPENPENSKESIPRNLGNFPENFLHSFALIYAINSQEFLKIPLGQATCLMA